MQETKPLTISAFLKDTVPVMMDLGNRQVKVCYHDPDGTARWVIKDAGQRLRMRDAIAKDVHVLEDHVFPGCTQIEVLDMVDGHIYKISVRGFQRYMEVLEAGAGKQYLVERKHWIKIRARDAAPKQGRLEL